MLVQGVVVVCTVAIIMLYILINPRIRTDCDAMVQIKKQVEARRSSAARLVALEDEDSFQDCSCHSYCCSLLCKL